MDRIVILGRGGAGKSTLARRLEAITGLPAIELDGEFWNERLEPLPPAEWRSRQALLAERDQWIMDGDLGPYDDVEPRLRRADTVVVLDLSAWRCVFRTLRRGRQRRDFWVWMLGWRRRDRADLLQSIAELAPHADMIVLASPAAVRHWCSSLNADPGQRGKQD